MSLVRETAILAKDTNRNTVTEQFYFGRRIDLSFTNLFALFEHEHREEVIRLHVLIARCMSYIFCASKEGGGRTPAALAHTQPRQTQPITFITAKPSPSHSSLPNPAYHIHHCQTQPREHSNQSLTFNIAKTQPALHLTLSTFRAAQKQPTLSLVRIQHCQH